MEEDFKLGVLRRIRFSHVADLRTAVGSLFQSPRCCESKEEAQGAQTRIQLAARSPLATKDPGGHRISVSVQDFVHILLGNVGAAGPRFLSRRGARNARAFALYHSDLLRWDLPNEKLTLSPDSR